MDLTVSILKCRFVELSVNIDLAPGQMSGFATFRGNDNFSNLYIKRTTNYRTPSRRKTRCVISNS